MNETRDSKQEFVNSRLFLNASAGTDRHPSVKRYVKIPTREASRGLDVTQNKKMEAIDGVLLQDLEKSKTFGDIGKLFDQAQSNFEEQKKVIRWLLNEQFVADFYRNWFLSQSDSLDSKVEFGTLLESLLDEDHEFCLVNKYTSQETSWMSLADFFKHYFEIRSETPLSTSKFYIDERDHELVGIFSNKDKIRWRASTKYMTEAGGNGQAASSTFQETPQIPGPGVPEEAQPQRNIEALPTWSKDTSADEVLNTLKNEVDPIRKYTLCKQLLELTLNVRDVDPDHVIEFRKAFSLLLDQLLIGEISGRKLHFRHTANSESRLRTQQESESFLESIVQQATNALENLKSEERGYVTLQFMSTSISVDKRRITLYANQRFEKVEWKFEKPIERTVTDRLVTDDLPETLPGTEPLRGIRIQGWELVKFIGGGLTGRVVLAEDRDGHKAVVKFDGIKPEFLVVPQNPNSEHGRTEVLKLRKIIVDFFKNDILAFSPQYAGYVSYLDSIDSMYAEDPGVDSVKISNARTFINRMTREQHILGYLNGLGISDVPKIFFTVENPPIVIMEYMQDHNLHAYEGKEPSRKLPLLATMVMTQRVMKIVEKVLASGYTNNDWQKQNYFFPEDWFNSGLTVTQLNAMPFHYIDYNACLPLYVQGTKGRLTEQMGFGSAELKPIFRLLKKQLSVKHEDGTITQLAPILLRAFVAQVETIEEEHSGFVSLDSFEQSREILDRMLNGISQGQLPDVPVATTTIDEPDFNYWELQSKVASELSKMMAVNRVESYEDILMQVDDTLSLLEQWDDSISGYIDQKPLRESLDTMLTLLDNVGEKPVLQNDQFFKTYRGKIKERLAKIPNKQLS